MNYVSTPIVREKSDRHLLLESVRIKIWNPVFTVGVVTFVSSMLFRGFLDAQFAVIPLAASTLVLFSGVWILSQTGVVVLDKEQSNCYCIYRHLGYLQKIYTYPLTSIDKVILHASGGKFILQLLKDDGAMVTVAASGRREELVVAASEIAAFLKMPMEG